MRTENELEQINELENNPIEHQEPGNDPINGSWQSASRVLVRGNNPSEFLQGYLTSDLTRLVASQSPQEAPPGAAPTIPMSLCNLKGRVIVSGWVRELADDCLELAVHNTLATKLCETLAPYARFSRCELSIEPEHPQVVTSTDMNFLDSLSFIDQHELTTEDISESMNRRLISHGIAFLSAENSEKFLPQVLNLHTHGFVDFDKGCYLGQEIVARAQFRGQVKKTVQSFSWTGSMPKVGAAIESGIVIAVTSTPPGDTGKGLAVS
ncbi:MAG: hypothetical protein GKR90_03140 [Pseudomonadales bacterium]|nr:hypothetical protein [Pseudomonadales bacterium]